MVQGSAEQMLKVVNENQITQTWATQCQWKRKQVRLDLVCICTLAASRIKHNCNSRSLAVKGDFSNEQGLTCLHFGQLQSGFLGTRGSLQYGQISPKDWSNVLNCWLSFPIFVTWEYLKWTIVWTVNIHHEQTRNLQCKHLLKIQWPSHLTDLQDSGTCLLYPLENREMSSTQFIELL